MIISNVLGAGLRLKFKMFQKHQAVDICQKLANAKKVLIYMPQKVEQFGAALKALERLRKARPKWKITVLSKMEMVSFIDTKLKLDILPYSKNDINFAGLPRTALRQLIQKSNFDIALDLNLKFDIFVIALFNISNAPIRVCFNNNEKAPFHNVEIRVNQAESLTNKYNAMVKYITMISDMAESQETLPKTGTKVK